MSDIQFLAILLGLTIIIVAVFSTRQPKWEDTPVPEPVDKTPKEAKKPRIIKRTEEDEYLIERKRLEDKGWNQ